MVGMSKALFRNRMVSVARASQDEGRVIDRSRKFLALKVGLFRTIVFILRAIEKTLKCFK